MSNRPTRDEYFMNMVELVSTRGTCLRRKTGCVLVNSRGHVLATGYNGRASGLRECSEEECLGAHAASGTRLDACEAIHAEANALLQCKDVYDIQTAYCTTSPCNLCVGLLMNTGCTRILFLESYPHERAGERWCNSYAFPQMPDGTRTPLYREWIPWIGEKLETNL